MEDLESGSESLERLLPQSDKPDSNMANLKTNSTNNNNNIIIKFIISICLIIPFSVWIGYSLGREYAMNADAAFRKIQKYSPILNEVKMTASMQRFNGSLLKENIYRQDAGAEVDEVWAKLGVNYRSLVIPASEAEKSGLLSDQVKINEKYGGGYPANVEGLHQLHCLNLLRQALYYNYNYYHAQGLGAFRNDDNIVKYHVSHCLDIIRQQLMCTVDTGVLGQVWWNKTGPQAYVDFNTQHMCRDFEAVRKWAEERQIPEEVPDDYLQPPKLSDTVYDSIP